MIPRIIFVIMQVMSVYISVSLSETKTNAKLLFMDFTVCDLLLYLIFIPIGLTQH